MWARESPQLVIGFCSDRHKLAHYQYAAKPTMDAYDFGE